jgi:hypothetical protein
MLVGLKSVMDWAAFSIVTDFMTLVATYLSSAAWEAVTTQVPAAMTVKDVPSIEQTPDEVVLKVTGAVPRPLVALNVCALLSVVMLVGLKRVILWATLVIMIDLLMLAGEYVSFPAWAAVIKQSPALTVLRTVPLTVQISVVVLVNVTGSPLLALAVSEYTGVVAAIDPTGVKVTFCGVKLNRVTVTREVFTVPSSAVTTTRIAVSLPPNSPVKGVVPLAPRY